MGDFLDRFLPDPEFSDSRWMWETAKPFLKDAVVQFAPYDPSFHEYKLPKNKPYPLDPSCPYARVADDNVAVVLYSRNPEATPFQLNGWEYMVAHEEAVYESLMKKLRAIHARCLEMFLEEEMPGHPPFEKHWAHIQSEIEAPEKAVDRFYKFVGISLTSSGLDECGFVGFEFQCGWDLDHGVQVLMHKDRVLAAVGMTELASPNRRIIDGVKAVQQYEPDPDDFLIV